MFALELGYGLPYDGLILQTVNGESQRRNRSHIRVVFIVIHGDASVSLADKCAVEIFFFSFQESLQIQAAHPQMV